MNRPLFIKVSELVDIVGDVEADNILRQVTNSRRDAKDLKYQECLEKNKASKEADSWRKKRNKNIFMIRHSTKRTLKDIGGDFNLSAGHIRDICRMEKLHQYFRYRRAVGIKPTSALSTLANEREWEFDGIYRQKPE